MSWELILVNESVRNQTLLYFMRTWEFRFSLVILTLLLYLEQYVLNISLILWKTRITQKITYELKNNKSKIKNDSKITLVIKVNLKKTKAYLFDLNT